MMLSGQYYCMTILCFILRNCIVVVTGKVSLQVSYHNRWRRSLLSQRRRLFSKERFHQNTKTIHLTQHYSRNKKSSIHTQQSINHIANFINISSYFQKKERTSHARTSLSMTLLPIPRESITKLITTDLPTPAQYAFYWGRTSREQYNALFESFGVSFLGVFVSYFLSFAIGQFVATIFGMVAGFWIILSPEVKAYQRNWELLGGRELVDPWEYENDSEEDKRGLYGEILLSYFHNICTTLVRQFKTKQNNSVFFSS